MKERLEFMLIDMGLPRELIIANPDGLITRTIILKERHLFLKSLGRSQYDPHKPNYVSVEMITHGDDSVFCQNVAKTPVELYNLFLKTL